jgi:AcrR family transcriptional regulator
VRRSRLALLLAAQRLVAERGTTEISVQDLTDAADVSRSLLYQHFRDRDALIAAAAAELIGRELLPSLPADAAADLPLTAFAAHFAAHRTFYRAVLTGTCSYAAIGMVGEAFHRARFGVLDDRDGADVARFFSDAAALALTRWLADDGPLDPAAFARRLALITGA